MAYGLKYYVKITDPKGVEWEVQLYQEGFSDQAREIIGNAPAFSLIYEGENADLFNQTILPSRLEMRLIVDDSLLESDIISLTNASETDWRVDLRLVVTHLVKDLKWRGNLLPEAYEIERGPYPFIATLTATDGLARLKDIPFSDPDASGSVQYTGRESSLEIMVKILNKLGHELLFRTADDWFETRMLMGQNDDPLAQARIDQALFWDIDNQAAWDCLTVLSDLLKRKSLQLLQSNGSWYITQMTELAKPTLIERLYLDDGSVAFTPSSVVDRSIDIDNINNHIEYGSSEAAQRSVISVSIQYDHGILENFLSNGGFEYWDEAFFPLPFPLIWFWNYQGTGPWGHGLIHYHDGIDSFKMASDKDDANESGWSSGDYTADNTSWIEQECFSLMLADPENPKTLSLEFAAFAGLINDEIIHYDPLCIPDAYYALTCGSHSAFLNFDSTKIEWRENSGNPNWISYGATRLVPGDWSLITSLPIDPPPTEDKIKVYLSDMIERIPVGHVQSFGNFYLDSVRLLMVDTTVPSTVRTTAALNNPISTSPYDLGIVYQGDGPVVEAIGRITLAGDVNFSELWTRGEASISDAIPLSYLQTKMIASAQRTASRMISANVLAEFNASNVLLIDGARFAFRGGSFNVDDAECNGVWQEIKDDQADSVVTEVILQNASSSGPGGSSGGGTGGGGGGGSIAVSGYVTSGHSSVVTGNNTITFNVPLLGNTYECLTVLYDASGIMVEWGFSQASSKLSSQFNYNSPGDGTLFYFAILH